MIDSIPKLYIMAGGNGSGKTTIAKDLLPEYFNCTEFVNADIIAEGISPHDVAAVAVKAGKMTLKLIDKLFDDQTSFALETTLSGKLHERIIERAQKKNYHVILIYVWVRSSGVSIKRVKQRSKLGGHFVRKEDVIRRYKRGLINLFDTYMNICDTWAIIDNTDQPKKLVAVGTGLIEITITNYDIWKQIESDRRNLESGTPNIC